MKQLVIILSAICMAGVVLFAQEGGNVEKIPVKGGSAAHLNLKFPVFPGVNEVEPSQFDGIEYTVKFKSEKLAMAGTKKIMNFYTGKKIGRHKIKKFTKVGKPDTVAWMAQDCAGDTGATVTVSVYESEVFVRALASCTDAGILF